MYLFWQLALLLVFGPVLCLLGLQVFLWFLAAIFPVLLLLTLVRGIVTGVAAGLSAGLILRRRLPRRDHRKRLPPAGSSRDLHR